MKSRVFSVVMMVLSFVAAPCQEWIGNAFSLDTIVPLAAVNMPRNMNLVKCRIVDSCFYFVEQQGFQYDRGKDRFAVIYAISLKDHVQREIVVPAPQKNGSARGSKRISDGDLWIYDFDFYENLLIVTTQEEILVYRKEDSSGYQLVFSDCCHKNLHTSYIEGDRLHIFEEDHDGGYLWFHKDIGGDSATLVRELAYEAPHVVQIQPNRHLSHDKEHVYFLSTRHPRFEIYAKSGELIRTEGFELPGWKCFDDYYIRRSLEKPYGIERILSVKDDLFSYSYPKMAFHFDDGLMLFYLQFDTTIGKSVLQYAILDHDKQLQRYSFNHDDGRYVAAQFPFDLMKGGYDKGSFSSGNTLVQLTYYSDVSWKNKTDEEYKDELNRYFESNDANVAYKIMHFTGNSDAKPTNGGVRDRKGDSIHNIRRVYVVHGDLECSGCVRAIYRLLDMATCRLGIHQIYRLPVAGVYRAELKKNIGQALGKDFVIESRGELEKRGVLLPELSESDFPCLLLESENGSTHVFRVSEIFTEDISRTEFRKDFIDIWEAYVHDSE